MKFPNYSNSIRGMSVLPLNWYWYDDKDDDPND